VPIYYAAVRFAIEQHLKRPICSKFQLKVHFYVFWLSAAPNVPGLTRGAVSYKQTLMR